MLCKQQETLVCGKLTLFLFPFDNRSIGGFLHPARLLFVWETFLSFAIKNGFLLPRWRD
jgi:hypothetical protein